MIIWTSSSSGGAVRNHDVSVITIVGAGWPTAWHAAPMRAVVRVTGRTAAELRGAAVDAAEGFAAGETYEIEWPEVVESEPHGDGLVFLADVKVVVADEVSLF